MRDSIQKDLNCPWKDPMAESVEQHLAQELRGVGLSAAYDMPEWKKDESLLDKDQSSPYRVFF